MLTFLIRALALIVPVLLAPALAFTVGSVAGETMYQVSGPSTADQYPVAYPSVGQVQVLADTLSPLPALGGEWRWGELDARGSCAITLARSRVVILDPDMTCNIRSTIFHEWVHLAQVVYYGGTTTPEGEVVSDIVDEKTGRPYRVPVQEVVADCGSLLLVDKFGGEQPSRSYLPMIGGCPAHLLALAHDVVTNAGVSLPAGRAASLAAIGSGVA